MQDLKTWREQKVKPFLKQSTEQEDYVSFMRDEVRPIIKNERVFLSAADGVVLYNQIVRSPKQTVPVKGTNYSIDDLIGEEELITGPALVCGVFMTFADIHLNRIPYSGILEYKKIDPIELNNMSMDEMERDIFQGLDITHYSSKPADYVRHNARMRNKVYIPSLDYSYYIIQIADYEVDVIQHFDQKQQKKVFQGDRFSFIRWGSQCDLILPLRKDLNIYPLIKPMMHVEAGLDKIINFI
jgi:phosphatidylserine decarboxylase